MNLINLALRTEYSFKQTFQHIGEVWKGQQLAVGIADINNTFGHVPLEKQCKENGIKPIFGVRLMVVENVNARPKGQQGNFGPYYIFLAKNVDGLQEIYRLVKKAYECFFFRPHIGLIDLFRVSTDIIVIATSFSIEERIDYIGVNYSTPIKCLKSDLPKVFINDNEYPTTASKPVYELLCGVKKIGTGYSYNFNSHTYPTHILSEEEFLYFYNDDSAIEHSHAIASQCNVTLPKADMVRYSGTKNLEKWCQIGAKQRNIDLENPIYKARLERELKLIAEKDYGDYFLNVAELIEYTKKHMLIGPSRGSSAGSLVCYLMNITEIDPIKYGLLFERFIAVNRFDLPDIDIDFPDNGRDKAIKFLIKKHGIENVSHIATISRFMSKSAIGDFACGLGIPAYETEEIKNAIIERSGGDARAAMCIEDTFKSTEIGKSFIKKYPNMELTTFIESHAKHTGTHAAGIIVCNDSLQNYCGINSRDNTIMAEKDSAEYLGLLKIDILGLRTLTILEEATKFAEIDFHKFYELDLNDSNIFNLINSGRTAGIFQFDGKTVGLVATQMGIETFNDMCAVTALGRPGALNTGGTMKYIKYRTGKEKPESIDELYDQVTKDTYGIIVFQEQAMTIFREYGGLSWGEVDILRRAMSKSYGDEFFSGYKLKFVNGAKQLGHAEQRAIKVWDTVASMGSYGFNKSHAVGYATISYWTAWMKYYYPLEFAAANLNHAKDENNAIRLLRDFVLNDKIEYISIDPDNSDVYWTIKDGKLLGGLTNIKGIGVKKARHIIKCRKEMGFTPAITKTLLNPVNVFDVLFPIQKYFGVFYDNPTQIGLTQAPTKIIDVQESGTYTILGKLIERDLRNRNDVQSVIKRGSMVEKDQFYLNLFIEDDTDDIKCTIPPFLMDKLNCLRLAEEVKINETYFLIKGKVQKNWRSISISAIFDITSYKTI